MGKQPTVKFTIIRAIILLANAPGFHYNAFAPLAIYRQIFGWVGVAGTAIVCLAVCLSVRLVGWLAQSLCAHMSF